jgi:hypothetical protein
MDAFKRELAGRLPLAQAVLETFSFAFAQEWLQTLYDQNRGRCYTDALSFSRLVDLVRDGLLQHGGSGHRVCVEAERDGTLEVDESSFYRKLAKMPVDVSRALLREATVHLTELMPPRSALLPGCLESFRVVVLDGKKIKNAAKRLKPTRGYRGALLGAKALVAMELRSGLAIAMSDSLDGEANDVPLVPELLPQVREVIHEPILFVSDRQFGGLTVPPQLSERPGDHFVVRLSKATSFQADSSHPARHLKDDQGREVIDEIGMLGKGVKAMRVRRITLLREDDDVILITDLLDRRTYPALDLLGLYRHRWGIEQMFQQVTETFSLKHLIGSTPLAILFQMAFCLLMYNLIKVVKAYVAEDGKVDREQLSTANLFYDVKRELGTWSYLGVPVPEHQATDAQAMCRRLRNLLRGSWDAVAYTKAVDQKPRKKKPKPKSLHGGHTSVQRLLDGKVRIRPTKA